MSIPKKKLIDNLEKKNLYNNMLLFKEFPDLEKCKSIYLHKDIWGLDRLPLMDYCEEALKYGFVKVSYEKKKYGRFYPKNNKYCCATMWNKTRTSLFGNTELDVDIVSAHYRMFRGICKKNNIECELIDNYCDRRDKIIEETELNDDWLKAYNKENKSNLTKKDIVKHLFTCLLYGGSIDTFKTYYKFDNDDYKISCDLEALIKEIKSASKKIIKLKDYKKIVKWTTEMKKQKAKDKYGDNFNEEQFFIKDGTKISYILQELECNAVIKAIQFLKKCGVKVSSYIYDGFQIIKSSVSQDKLKEYLNVINSFDEDIEFIVKPFKDGLDVEKIETKNFDINIFNDLFKCAGKYKEKAYKYQRKYFEMTHFKLTSPLKYIRTYKREYIEYKRDGFKNLCANLNTWIVKKTDEGKIYERKSFFPIWEKEGDIRFFEKLTFLPPPLDGECPDNHYNTWSGFEIEDIPLDTTADTSRIHKHFKHISNHDDKVCDYLLDWYASIIQNPGIKTRTMPILHGKEGTGKSIIAEYLMPKMLGRNKTFTTCKADTLFGKFAKLQGKIFIVYNESNAKDTFKYAEDVKDAITVDYGTSEKKCVDIEDNVRFFTNFISTTNNIVSFKISPTCRRTIAIEVDSSIANNKQYFNDLYADLENDTIVRNFYEELKIRPISNFDTINDRPVTELTNAIKQASLDTIQLFSFKLDEYINKLYNEVGLDGDLYNEVGIDGDLIYEGYRRYYKDNGGNNETIKKKQTFLATFKQSNNSFITRDRPIIDDKRVTRYFINEEQYKIFLEKNDDLIT